MRRKELRLLFFSKKVLLDLNFSVLLHKMTLSKLWKRKQQHMAQGIVCTFPISPFLLYRTWPHFGGPLKVWSKNYNILSNEWTFRGRGNATDPQTVQRNKKYTTGHTGRGRLPHGDIKSYSMLLNSPFASSLMYHFATLSSHHTQLYKMLRPLKQRHFKVFLSCSEVHRGQVLARDYQS